MVGFARPTLATPRLAGHQDAIPRGTNSWSGSTDFGLFAGSHNAYSLIPASFGAKGVWPQGCASRLNRCRMAFRKAWPRCSDRPGLAGSLHDFLSERWWRSGCEAILWDITDGNSFDLDQTLTVLNRHCGSVLVRSPVSGPVLCIDKKFNIGANVCEMSNAIRVQLDDSPPYAEQAWTPLQLGQENARLRAGVIAMDRERLVNQADTGSEVG